MPKYIRITAHDADRKPIGFSVIELPDDHPGRPPWPANQPSDSHFETEEEALEEIKRRVAGKKPCECGCGYYPKGKDSRFMPGHDLRKAYQDRPSNDK